MKGEMGEGRVSESEGGDWGHNEERGSVRSKGERRERDGCTTEVASREGDEGVDK